MSKEEKKHDIPFYKFPSKKLGRKRKRVYKAVKITKDVDLSKGIDLSRPGSTETKVIPIDKIVPSRRTPVVTLADREGVFIHSFKCLDCCLEYLVFSWKEFRHTAENCYCPECGKKGHKLHSQTTINTRKKFDITAGDEIYNYVRF